MNAIFSPLPPEFGVDLLPFDAPPANTARHERIAFDMGDKPGTMNAALAAAATVPDTPGAQGQSYKRICGAAQYHADLDIQSCSMLKPMLVSPAHYIAALTQRKSTAAMETGTLLHTLVLEPHTAPQVMAVFPDDLKTPDGKAFVRANPDRICISLLELVQLQTAARITRDALFRGRPFYKFIEEGEVEPGLYYTDPTTGVQCRTRPDLFHPDITFDLKTSRHAGTHQFQMDAVAMHYDLQAFMYSMARCLYEGTNKPKPFVFVKLETEVPHSVHFMPSSEAFLENGFRKYAAALAGVQSCRTADIWPPLQGEVVMDLQPWQVFKGDSSGWVPTISAL